MRFLLFLVTFTIAICSEAQEPAKLLLMNGKVLEVYQLDDTSKVNLQYRFDDNYYKRLRINRRAARDSGIVFEYGFTAPKAEKLPFELVKGSHPREEVFAITDTTGQESVLYEMDQPAGKFLQPEEMRAYVYGSRDARNAVRGKGWFYAGLGVGAAAGYLLETSIFTLAVPPVFALTTRIPVIKIKKKNIADQQYRFNEDYAAGYESYARGKHTIEALKGSAIGAVIGIIAYSVVDNNR